MAASLCPKFRFVPGLLKGQNAYVSIWSHFSAEQAAVVPKVYDRCRTLENNPNRHTLDHIGKFYRIDTDVRNKIFFSGGIPKSLETQMDTFRETCIMVRKPSLEIISFLENINYSQPAVRFVLYGKLGTGKTASLIHIVHYAYESKYLLLHIPWLSNWTKRPKEKVDSQYKPGRIDLPVESALWLQHFKLQNSHLLQELNLMTTKSYSWSKREVTEEGKPITEIIEHGLNRVQHSSDCIGALLREIKHHSQFGRFRSLVVIDGVNAIYSKTNVRRPDKTVVPAKDLTIVHAFMKMIKNDWTNAAIVTTVDTIPANRYECIDLAFTPRALLGKEGFELLDPFIPIEMVNYTEKEVESVLDYYNDRMWLTLEDARNEKGRNELKFLSGKNPLDLMLLCDSL